MRGIRIFPVVLFLGGTLSAGAAQGQTPAGEGVEVALPLRPQTPFTAPGELSTVTFVQIDSPPDGKTQNAEANDGAGPSQGQAGKQQGSTQNTIACGLTHVGQCLKDLGHDQAGIWTSPLRIRSNDAYWLLPFAAATGVALHYDAQAQQQLGIDKTRIDVSSTFSDVGLYGSIAGGGGLYLLGAATHNDHLAETGRLGEEAIVNSLLVVEALKLATNRERPNEGSGRGGFWPHGTRSYESDGSFPSGHAAATFAFARVLASEYPSKRVQLAAYALALAVSASRVTARQHFPSDVLVGGTFGYLIGGYVVRHRAAENVGSGFSFVPAVDVATHTFGANIALRPDQFDVAKVGRFVNRMRRK